MAGKLTTDEIKWILNMESKGLQRDAAEASKALKQLNESNKSLRKDIKDSEKEMSTMEKSLQKMAKSGEQSSIEYQSMKSHIEDLKNKIKGWNAEIKNNDAAIAENEKKHDDAIDAMKLEDMTMKQLIDRSKEVKAALKNMDPNSKEYSIAQKELDNVSDAMSNLSTKGKGTINTLAAMPNPVGAATRAVKGFAQGLKALALNPVGAILMVVVGVFMLFKKAITSSEEVLNKFNQLLAPVGRAVQWVMNLVQKLVGNIIDGISKAIGWVGKLLEKMPVIGDKIKEINEHSREARDLEKAKLDLKKEEREYTVQQAKLEGEVSELRNKANQKDKYSAKERLAFIDEAMAKEKSMAEQEKAIAEEKLRIAKTEASWSDNDAETNDKLAELEANVARATTSYNNATRELAEKRNSFLNEMLTDQKNAIKIHLEQMKIALDEESLKIRENGMKNKATEEEITLAINQVTEKGYKDRIQYLTTYIAKVKDPTLKQELTKQLSESNIALMELQQKDDEAKIKQLQTELQKRLQANDDAYKLQANIFSQALAKRKITQEQHDILMMGIDKNTADTRLSILQLFGKDMQDLEIANGKLKEDAVKDINDSIVDTEQDAAMKRIAVEQATVQAVLSLKQEYNQMTLEQELDLQMKALDGTYQARKELLISQGASTLELDEAYEIAKDALILDHENKRFSIRQQLGIATTQEQYRLEMDNLEQMHKDGLISEEEYQQAKFVLVTDQIKAQYDYWSDLVSNAVNAMQQAEMDMVDAKYDVMIQSAKGNAEEEERLENEKAQKKLDIEKKYADTQFAIKVSNIVANTAVAIMTAFAQLGPIAGAIAAVLMGATGVAQIISANAERQKVKNMTLGGGGSAAASAPKTRSVIGAEEGGYVNVKRRQDGQMYRAKNKGAAEGYVDETSVLVAEDGEEFVINNKSLSNPNIRKMVDVIDMAQRGGYERQLNLKGVMPGYASGGYINGNSNYNGSSSESEVGKVLVDIREFLSSLKENGVKAPIVLTELQKKMALEETSNQLAER